jgi:hypothetical protein
MWNSLSALGSQLREISREVGAEVQGALADGVEVDERAADDVDNLAVQLQQASEDAQSLEALNRAQALQIQSLNRRLDESSFEAGAAGDDAVLIDGAYGDGERAGVVHPYTAEGGVLDSERDLSALPLMQRADSPVSAAGTATATVTSTPVPHYAAANHRGANHSDQAANADAEESLPAPHHAGETQAETDREARVQAEDMLSSFEERLLGAGPSSVVSAVSSTAQSLGLSSLGGLGGLFGVVGTTSDTPQQDQSSAQQQPQPERAINSAIPIAEAHTDEPTLSDVSLSSPTKSVSQPTPTTPLSTTAPLAALTPIGRSLIAKVGEAKSIRVSTRINSTHTPTIVHSRLHTHTHTLSLSLSLSLSLYCVLLHYHQVYVTCSGA